MCTILGKEMKPLTLRNITKKKDGKASIKIDTARIHFYQLFI